MTEKEKDRGCSTKAERHDRGSSKLRVTLQPAPRPYRRRNTTRSDRAPFQPAFEIGSQITCRAIARLRLALQAMRADRFQITIQCRRERAQLRCRIFAGLLDHSQSVFA